MNTDLIPIAHTTEQQNQKTDKNAYMIFKIKLTIAVSSYETHKLVDMELRSRPPAR